MASWARWLAAGVVGTALALAAILGYWRGHSSAPNGLAAPEPPESLPVTVHAVPKPLDLARVRFTDAAGAAVSLADFRGRIVVVNLWATWCAPCLREMPALDRLEGVLGGADFRVVAVSQDRAGLLEVAPFWQRTGLEHLAIYLDPSMGAARALGARGLPTSLLLDREGRELARLEGTAEWDAPEVVAYFRALTPGSQPGG